MITVGKCSCGHPACSKYWLGGIGDFVQGSGFSKIEAERIANALNRQEHVLDLSELISTQARLQARMGDPTGLGEAGVKESLLHVIVESVEALREINFKPWKTKQFEVDRSSLATEMTDILQFWANAALAMDFTPRELTDALRAKWNINHQRIDNGDVVEEKS